MYTLYREEPDGTETVVAYVDDQCMIGCIIDEDRNKIDYDPKYRAERDKDDTLRDGT